MFGVFVRICPPLGSWVSQRLMLHVGTSKSGAGEARPTHEAPRWPKSSARWESVVGRATYRNTFQIDDLFESQLSRPFCDRFSNGFQHVFWYLFDIFLISFFATFVGATFVEKHMEKISKRYQKDVAKHLWNDRNTDADNWLSKRSSIWDAFL